MPNSIKLKCSQFLWAINGKQPGFFKVDDAKSKNVIQYKRAWQAKPYRSTSLVT